PILNSKLNFEIRNWNHNEKKKVQNRYEKQIQNHRFASMAHETEHDFWLKLDAASRVKRTEVSILKHHLYSEEQDPIRDIVIKAMH
ncbi:unnamed protein product, partial [Rotaria magnacalcarata]